MDDAAPAPAIRWRAWAGAAAIAFLTIVAYLPAIDAGFIWDDGDYLTANPHLLDLAGLARIWTPGETHQYYPLVFTTFWVEHKLWGLEPVGFHFVNVLLHIANAILLWRLLGWLGVPGAWVIGAVFALHPVHVESVAWITERKNVLSGTFYLLAAFAFLRYERDRAMRFYGPALLAFAAALLSKSVACSLPAALLLVLLWRDPRRAARAVVPLLPFFALGLIAALNTAYLERTNVGAIGAAFDLSFVERCLVAARALLFYPMKLLVPAPLMFVYPRWVIDAAAPLAYLPVALVLAAGAIACVAFARGRRAPFVALAFYAGTVFPAIGFVNVYPHRFSFVADHFQYLASIGIIALVVAPVCRRLGRPGRVAPVAGAVLATLGVLTWMHATTFEDAETVWRDTLRKNDDAWLAHHNLSNILLRQAGDADPGAPETRAMIAEARAHAERVIALQPTHHRAHNSLAEALRLQGEYEAAVPVQERAIAIVRESLRSDDITPPFLKAYEFQLGRLHQLRGHYHSAAQAFARALDLDPGMIEAHLGRGAVLNDLELPEQARPHFEAVVAARPDFVPALAALAAIAEARADYQAADGWYRRAIASARHPLEGIPALTRLISLLANCPDPAHRNVDEAIELARGLVALSDGRDAAALDVLAAVYHGAGRVDDAIATAERALTVARAAGRGDLAAQIEGRLESYRAARGRP